MKNSKLKPFLINNRRVIAALVLGIIPAIYSVLQGGVIEKKFLYYLTHILIPLFCIWTVVELVVLFAITKKTTENAENKKANNKWLTGFSVYVVVSIIIVLLFVWYRFM